MNNQTLILGLLICSAISAVLNYAGFSYGVDDNDWWQKSLYALTASGVFIFIYLFWSHAFKTVPDLKLPGKRLASWANVVAGIILILGVSTYWNLVANTGAELERLSLSNTLPKAETMLARAIDANGSYLSLKPQLDAFAARITNLAEGEERSGAITGSPGKGGVASILHQISANVTQSSKAVSKASGNTTWYKKKGQTCLIDMRAAARKGAVNGGVVFAKADCLNDVVAGLGNLDVASMVERSMMGLTSGIILPVSIRTAKQKQAVRNILSGLQKQANTIARAAAAIESKPVPPLVVERPNVMMAVLIHWRSIIPAISTAVAIDLLPLILLIFRVLLYRDAEERGEPRHPWTANELLDAQTQFRKLTAPELDKLPTPPVRLISYDLDDDDWWEVPEITKGKRT